MSARLFIGLVFMMLATAACQSAPTTQIVLVVTATPSAGAITIDSAEGRPGNGQPAEQSPSSTSTATMTATPDPFPTPTIGQMQVAEQVFEHGRMFWLQPTRQIWVLVGDTERGGTWTVYEDTFEEGMMEFDPDITAPEGLIQPERGFGKLWRENDEVREVLGWAITPEFGYVSEYEYHPGGSVADGEYVPGPGQHIWYSLFEEEFRFDEGDNTWQGSLQSTEQAPD